MFFKEKYANLQEPEDVKFYLNIFEDPNASNKAPVVEESPNKRIHTDTNSYVNVKPNGNIATPYQSNNE